MGHFGSNNFTEERAYRISQKSAHNFNKATPTDFDRRACITLCLVDKYVCIYIYICLVWFGLAFPLFFIIRRQKITSKSTIAAKGGPRSETTYRFRALGKWKTSTSEIYNE